MIRFCLSILGFMAAYSFQSVQAVPPVASIHQFPKVSYTSGDSKVSQKGEWLKAAALKKTLRESVLVETGTDGQVQIDLGPGENIIVGPNSRLLIPAIDWDTGKVEELELLSGRVALSVTEPRFFKTALSRDRLEKGRYEFGFSPERGDLQATVLDGSLKFRGLETEEVSHLQYGETQVFRGDKAEGELQYDILMGGRKVARGRLLAKRKLSKTELGYLEKLYAAKKSSALHAAKKAGGHDLALASRVGPVGKTAGKVLCQSPSAQFNECALLCLNNPKKAKDCQIQNPKVQCVRRRCLANGQWGDEFVYSEGRSPCSAKPIVQACDY